MMRAFAVACALTAVVLLLGTPADGQAQKQKNQMVKGTIKSVDASKDVLIVNQKVKNEVVDRELSILATTEFVVQAGGETKEATGKAGLALLAGKEGSPVQVKCDKDVNVLRVTVKLKK